jgi:hypothetical protein
MDANQLHKMFMDDKVNERMDLALAHRTEKEGFWKWLVGKLFGNR